MVYQEVNLLPNLTVAQNLTFGREPTRFGLVNARARTRLAKEMLEGYGSISTSTDLAPIRSLSSRSPSPAPSSLSGKVLILDEPTASLDAREVEMLFKVVRDLRDRGWGLSYLHFSIRYSPFPTASRCCATGAGSSPRIRPESTG